MISCSEIAEIILIDDDPIQHLVCQKMLQSLKIEVPIMNCYNGYEAISYIKEMGNYSCSSKIRLIFLDLNMPVMNGFEFLESYHGLDNHCIANDYLIILSSTILKSDRLIAMHHSALKGFYEKPLKLETLKGILRGIK